MAQAIASSINFGRMSTCKSTVAALMLQALKCVIIDKFNRL